MSEEATESKNQKAPELQNQANLDRRVLDLLETRMDRLKTVLMLTNDTKLENNAQAADIYIDLMDKRQNLIDGALEANEQLKAFSEHKLSGGSKTKAEALKIETDEITKQIIAIDKQNISLGSAILDGIRKDMKTLSGQKNANNAYSNDYAYDMPHFDKQK